MRNRLTIVLAACLLAATGCGGSDEPDSAQDAVGRWVAAINDRAWERACSLEDRPEGGCAERRESEYERVAGRLRATGGYQQGDERLFGVTSPEGTTGFSVRRVDGGWRVHPEIQIIR